MNRSLHVLSVLVLTLALLTSALASPHVEADFRSYSFPAPSALPQSSPAALLWWPLVGPWAAPHPRPLAASLDEIRIESPVGTDVPTKTLILGESFVFYAVGYEGSNPSAQVVTWTQSSPNVGILSTQVNTMTTLQATALGSGVLTATHTTTPTLVDTAAITVSSGTLHHFDLSAPVSATAGSGFTLTVIAKNSYNYTMTDFGQAVTLSVDAGTIVPTLIGGGDFSQGVWSGPVTLTRSGFRTVSATRGSVSDAASLTVNPDALNTLTVTPGSAQVTVGTTRAFTATGIDQFGNRVTLDPQWSSDVAQSPLSSSPGLTATATFTAQHNPAPASGFVTATQNGVSDKAAVTVTVGPLADLVVTPNSVTVQVGLAQTFTATGTDQYGNRVTLDPQWNSDVAQSPFSGSPGLTATAIFTAQHSPAPASGFVTATQSGVSDRATVNVAVGPLFTVTVSPPSATVTVHTTRQFTAGGTDQYGNPVTVVPTWTVTGGQIIIGPLVTTVFTAQDSPAPDTGVVTAHENGLTGQAAVAIQPGPADHFYFVTAVPTLTAGSDLGLHIEARDAFDNVATGYNGTAALDDATGTIAPSLINFVEGHWTGSISITLAATGVRITATDGLTSGASNLFTVLPADLDYFDLSGYPGSIVAGEPFPDPVTVTAYDRFDNVKTNYTGTVQFDSSDISETVPGDYTFVPGDAGVRAFSGDDFAFYHTTQQTFTVTDQAQSVSASSDPVTVIPAALDSLTLEGYPASTVAGQVFPDPVTVRAFDRFGNLKTNYAGTVQFDSSDALADLPGDYIFNPGSDAGRHAFSGNSFRLYRAPAQTVTVQDQATAISATSTSILVAPAALDHFTLAPIGDQVAGVPFTLTVSAFDFWENPKTNYATQPQLSDTTHTIWPQQTQGCDWSLTGTCDQGVTITRARSDVRVTVTDGGIFVTSNPFTVSPAPLDHVRVNAAPDNDGQAYGYPVEVGEHTMDIYQTFAVWAGGYDFFDNYREDVTVTWSLGGVLAAGEIAPNPASGATFTPAPALSGTGTITATYVPNGLVDGTGLFTIQAPWLTIQKSGPNHPVPAGMEGMLYTILYTNVGDIPAQDVRITETYDSNVTFYGAVPSPNQGNNVWTHSVLGVNDPKTIGVFVNVADSLRPGTILTNVIQIDGLRLETHAFTETTTITSTPDLTVDLDDLGNDPVNAGSPLNLQVTFVNSGTAPVDNIVLTLTLDPRVTFQWAEETPVVTPTKAAGNVGRWEFVQLEGGDSQVSFIAKVQVDSLIPDQSMLVNRAIIRSDQTRNNPDYATELTWVNVPVLTLSKADTPDPVQANGLLTFTLAYTNQGHADALSVFLTDPIPENTAFYACQPTCELVGGVARWDVGTLPTNHTETATLVVAVQNSLDDGTVLTNTAGLEALYGYTATATLTTTVSSAPLLTLTQGVNVEPVRVTDELIYTLVYTNLGNGPAYGVVLTDVIPPHVTYQGGCEAADNCLQGGRWLTWTLGTVAASTGGRFDVRLRVDAPLPDHTRLSNRAVISAATRTRAASALTSTVIAPHLSLAIQDQPDPVQADAPLIYTFVYSNSGDGYVAAAVLTATPSAHVTFQSCTPEPCGLGSGGVITWDLGRVEGNEGGQTTLVVQVDNNLDNGTVITSTGRLVAPAEVVTAVAGLETTVESHPDVWVEVNNDRPQVEAGEQIIYTLRYGNSGNSNAYDTTLVATLPDARHVNYQSCQPQALCSHDSGLVTYQLGTVPGGTTDAVYVTVDVTDPLPVGARVITATATIDTTTPDDPLGDNAARDVDAIGTWPNLGIHVDHYAFTPYPGQRITYVVHYSNTGHINAAGVVVTATQPDYSTYDPAASGDWQELGEGRYAYDLGPLDYGETGNLLFVVDLPAGTFSTTMPSFDAFFGIYDNGSSGLDKDRQNNSVRALLGVPDVIVEKVDVNWTTLLSGKPGRHVTVTLKNVGKGIACNPVGFIPPNCGFFFIDLYISPDSPPPSFPGGSPWGDPIYDRAGPILPQQSLAYGLSFMLTDVPKLPLTLYVRVDNASPMYGLVPEYDEWNNVFGPVRMTHDLYLPLALRQHASVQERPDYRPRRWSTSASGKR